MFRKYRKEKAGKNDNWNKIFCSTCIGITNDIGICTQSYSFNEWAHLCSTKGTVQTNTENRKEMILLTFGLCHIFRKFSISYILNKDIYHIGFTCETLATNASPVWPDKVLPLLSTMVPETKIGTGA